MDHLDSEEKDFLRSSEQGEWKPIADLESEIERYREYARATLSRDQSAAKRKRPEERRPS